MMSGVRASSMKMLSASSTRAKWVALHRGSSCRGRGRRIHGAQNGRLRRPAAAELQPVAEEVEAELASRCRR